MHQRSANVERTMVPEATPSATFSETKAELARADGWFLSHRRGGGGRAWAPVQAEASINDREGQCAHEADLVHGSQPV